MECSDVVGNKDQKCQLRSGIRELALLEKLKVL
jgi:hypothetical protein